MRRRQPELSSIPDVVMANEWEAELPEILTKLHESESRFLNRGVFFDVYELDLPGDEKPRVFKDFRSGDASMSEKEQIALFQHQYYESVQMKTIVGEQFFPESYWIRNAKFSDDEAHGFYSVPGQTANTMTEFAKVQADRQFMNRYSSDDKRKGLFKKIIERLGRKFQNKETEFIGGNIQEYINGVPFSEVIKDLDSDDPNYETLQQNTRELIRGLSRFHADSPYTAFTWHGLSSENVLVELDDEGKITGRVMIIDANFTERPNKAFKQTVEAKLEKDVFSVLEDRLDLLDK